MLELHINKCKNLGPVIYAKSNPNHGFTKSVGFRDSLSKRKKIMVALEGDWRSTSGTRKNRYGLFVSRFQILFLTC